MARKDLTGEPIVITGASSGIGAATAVACAQAGMPVALGARRVEALERVAARVREAGGRVTILQTDVNDADQCRALVERCVDEFGSVYSVFANAGYGFEGAFHETPDDNFRAMFETNFWGSVYVIRPALEHMLEARRGHVLLCSSCVSKLGLPYYSAYSISKAMQDHLGRAMRHELRPLGVKVSTVHPVGTSSEFFDRAAELSKSDVGTIKTPDRFKQTPERVARAVVKCLHKPTGEVWTSLPMRLMLGGAVMLPRTTDLILKRRIGKRLGRPA